MPSFWRGHVSSIEHAGPRIKFVVIVILSIMGICFTMILEYPTASKQILLDEMNITSIEFDLQYHLVFWPSIFCWLAGLIVDRYLDLRIATVIFLTISCVGNTMYAIGGVTQIYAVMLIGRLITGLGVEVSCVFVSCYIILWFPSKLTNTVFALSKSLPLLGTLLVQHMTSGLITKMPRSMMKRHVFAVTTAAVMCIIIVPLSGAVILALISKPRRTRGNITTDQQTIKIMDIIAFPLRFWFLATAANIFLSSCLIFLRYFRAALNSKYNLNDKQTDLLISSFTIGGSLISPILGLVVDWKGRNLTFVTLALIGGLTAHFAFGFIITDPFYPMILLSFSYSMIIGSYWSLFTYMIKSNQLNTALGIDYSFFMVFCAVQNCVIPVVINSFPRAVEVFYLIAIFIALIAICFVWGLDCKTSDLNMSKNKREMISNKMVNGSQRQELMPHVRRTRQPVFNNDRRISKTTNELIYLRLKRVEAGSNMHKYHRRRRQINKLNNRRRSRSNEELHRL